MIQESKPQATEGDLIGAITTAINDVAKEKYVSQITMLGVLNALRIEQEQLFWEGQLRHRAQAAAAQPSAQPAPMQTPVKVRRKTNA